MTSKRHAWKSAQKVIHYTLDLGTHWILGHTAEDLGIEIAANETHTEVFCFQSLKMKELNSVIVFWYFTLWGK